MRINNKFLRKSLVSATLVVTVFAGSSNIFAAALPTPGVSPDSTGTDGSNASLLIPSTVLLPSLAMSIALPAASTVVSMASLFIPASLAMPL